MRLHLSQATPLAMGLQQGVRLLWRNLATVGQAVKGLSEGLLAHRTAVALAPLAGFAMPMSAGVVTERTLHQLVPVEFVLDYLSNPTLLCCTT